MTMEAEQGSIEVTYSAADIVALNLLVWPFWLSLVAIFAVILVILPLIFGVIDGIPARDFVRSIDWSFTAWLLLILIGWVIAVTVFTYWVRRRRGLHGPMRFRLTDEGVAVRNRRMDLVVFWPAIRSITISESRLFLFLTRRTALIVPQKAFDNDADFRAFVGAAEEHWRNSSAVNSSQSPQN